MFCKYSSCYGAMNGLYFYENFMQVSIPVVMEHVGMEICYETHDASMERWFIFPTWKP